VQLISNNPFRILGVKANASLSDRNQQANLIAQYLKIGQSAKLDLDITPPLEPLTRTKELIDLQASRIFSTEDKILHSLFWFVEANGIDKIALKHLTGSKDIHKALSDFEKGCRGFVVSPESYSAILNHSTLQIIAYKQHKDLDKLKSAIANKFDIITNKKTLAQIKDLVASDGINTDFQKILELDKKNIKAQTSIAKVKYESGDFEQSVLAAQKAIAWSPDFAQSHFWLAKGAHQMGYFDDALKSYGKAIKLNPDYGDAFYYRGALKISLEKVDSACEDFSHAKRLNVEGSSIAKKKYCS